jgi:hypothetical protein
MAFNINSFRAEIAKNGYLKNEHFSMTIVVPPALLNSQMTNQQRTTPAGNMPPTLTLRTAEARTPSGTLEWMEVPRYGIGLQQGQPYNAKMSNMFCEVICDKYGDIYNFFHTWLNVIFPFSPLVDSQGGSQINQSRATYLLNYKDEYATTININMFDVIGKLVLDFVLNVAFPVTIKEIPLDWEAGGKGGLVTLNIGFEYRDYSITTSNLGRGQYNTNLTSPASASSPAQTLLLNI